MRKAIVIAIIAGAMAATVVAQPSKLNLTGTVVAVNQQADTVTLIDLKTMQAYKHVQVVGGPHEAAVSPDGRRVLVTNYNKQGVGPQKTLSLIALPAGDVIKTIDLGGLVDVLADDVERRTGTRRRIFTLHGVLHRRPHVGREICGCLDNERDH